MRIKDGVGTPGADFHYAVIEDTFLYTTSTGPYGLHCINIANPESIFVNWSMDYYFGFCGFEVIDSFVFTATASEFDVGIDHYRPHWKLMIVQIHNDTSATYEHIEYFDNYHHGSIASNDEYLFYTFTEMSDWIYGEQDYTLGDSYLGIWGEDYSYTWSDYDSEGVFGVDVISDILIAVGFEHGFSILNYSNLDSIKEVAHYRDTDSIFAFTHFALKEDRLFAMAHPHPDTCRMYMFALDSAVISGISETAPPKPAEIGISAWPNPFNSSVTIVVDGHSRESVNPEGAVSVEIFDVNGWRVAQLPSPSIPLPGGEGGNSFSHWEKVSEGRMRAFTWQPAPSLPSGVYLVRATVGGCERTARVVYLK